MFLQFISCCTCIQEMSNNTFGYVIVFMTQPFLVRCAKCTKHTAHYLVCVAHLGANTPFGMPRMWCYTHLKFYGVANDTRENNHKTISCTRAMHYSKEVKGQETVIACTSIGTRANPTELYIVGMSRTYWAALTLAIT